MNDVVKSISAGDLLDLLRHAWRLYLLFFPSPSTTNTKISYTLGACQQLPPNPHQILIQQRLLLDPIDRLIHHRRRNLIELHARQPDQITHNRRRNYCQSAHMTRRVDEARSRNTYLHIFAVRLFREVEDMILNPALRA